jgi:hypothetical protein
MGAALGYQGKPISREHLINIDPDEEQCFLFGGGLSVPAHDELGNADGRESRRAFDPPLLPIPAVVFASVVAPGDRNPWSPQRPRLHGQHFVFPDVTIPRCCRRSSTARPPSAGILSSISSLVALPLAAPFAAKCALSECPKLRVQSTQKPRVRQLRVITTSDSTDLPGRFFLAIAWRRQTRYCCAIVQV